MDETPHKAIKMKLAAQAAVHKKIRSMDPEGLVQYFNERSSTLTFSFHPQNEQTTVMESRHHGNSQGN